jgi:hypothetical protein
MRIITDSAPDGESLKRQAQAILEAHRELLILRARRALLLHLLTHGTGTIDHVRAVVPAPASINPKAFGAVPGPLAVARIIRPTGFTKTTRHLGHARPVIVWELVDYAAAERWLRNHPEPEGEGVSNG